MHEAPRSLNEVGFPPDLNTIPELPRLPISPYEGYQTLPFQEGFDVPEILRMARDKDGLPDDHPFYLVDFSSQLKPDANVTLLIELDDAAHLEAHNSKGFSLYYRGDPDSQGHCRSFCVWQSMKEAWDASQKPAHREAADSVDDMYSWYQVSTREAQLNMTPLGFSFGLVKTHSSDGELHIGV